MASPSESLAASLEALKRLQDQGIVAIRTSQITRTHRQRLLKNGFIREVMRGWYIPTRPDEVPGESTAWYSSFWTFCADYLNERFGDDWCLSPEQSMTLFAGDWTVPKQVIVRSPKGGNKPLSLPYETSIFDVRLATPPPLDIETNSGMRVFSLPAGLIATSPTHFTAQPIVMRAALAAITDASEVLVRLLEGGHSTIAGRLAGAFRNIGRTTIADSIIETMRAAGYTVNEVDPFKGLPHVALSSRETSPYVNRVTMIWQKMREDVLEYFPVPPGRPTDKSTYLQHVDDVYAIDAYNSLSIEGYRVSAELIERVRSGDWNPDSIETDRNQRDALAARGYWQAFQRVKNSVGKVLSNENAGTVANADHGAWYRELFGPSITAGLLRPADLAGYRSGPVFIRRSTHVPPNRDAVRELMPAFFELLEKEAEPAVRVVMGHFIFVYIHPYFDGNGRMGRFLMNVMLASGGYPWTVIPVTRRNDYMGTLEKASAEGDIVPFAKFLGQLLMGDGK
ncbi:Fic family protein [Candidatus Nitrotoga sp. AM1P]|uniref:Fic family protein n=1 Tax=Candidatus Nitrotoga sp. AM1P TaxID=2559597 RepID=UPI0015646C86|nr:Fic family protein [Candidatus Nitrotoga sp. AM1P]